MVFENNSAAVGPVVYSSNMFECSWYSLEEPFFSNDFNLYWSFMRIRFGYHAPRLHVLGDIPCMHRNNYIILEDENRQNYIVGNVNERYIQTEVSSIVVNGNTNLVSIIMHTGTIKSTMNIIIVRLTWREFSAASSSFG